MSMFCYQCEQTGKGTGCTSFGVCGKDPPTSALLDCLVHVTKGIAQYAHRARQLGVKDRDIDVFAVESTFSTLTNVNFDADRVAQLVVRAFDVRDRARELYLGACAKAGRAPEAVEGPATWARTTNKNEMLERAPALGIEPRRTARGETLAGLEELVLYGVKGLSAYADHALILGNTSDEVFGFLHEALDFLTRDQEPEALLGMALRVGEVNLKVMELLDQAHTQRFGHPVPTQVRVTPVKGKAILVSGHDLNDLRTVLEQTEGTGVNVYTHGELLPAHGYPELKKYPHLVGNYGSAWQNQAMEFAAFPGPILMTTNCIQMPWDTYKARIFTTGLVAWPGVRHLPNGDFGPLVAAALSAPGFENDAPEKTITVGFGHNAVLSVADKVIDAVKTGAIRRFFLIGGCDGAKVGRDYYTRLAEAVPEDCVVLTLACGKYRFNKREFGAIGGIPRLLDIGQCNDAYSAIRIAAALADAFKTDVNGLPLSLVLSWYEQKAVAILLTLFHLGIKNIRLGPTLPAFLTPPVLNILVDKFAIKPIGTPEQDLNAMLAS